MLVITKSSSAVAASFTGIYSIPPLPVRVPLPNMAKMVDLEGGSYCESVQIQKVPVAVMGGNTSKSTGDEVPQAAGVVSGKQSSGAQATQGSKRVFAGGKPLLHIGSPMMMNEKNAQGVFLAPSQVTVDVAS